MVVGGGRVVEAAAAASVEVEVVAEVVEGVVEDLVEDVVEDVVEDLMEDVEVGAAAYAASSDGTAPASMWRWDGFQTFLGGGAGFESDGGCELTAFRLDGLGCTRKIFSPS